MVVEEQSTLSYRDLGGRMVWSETESFRKGKPVEMHAAGLQCQSRAFPVLLGLDANPIKHVTPPHTSGLLGSRCEAFGVGWDGTCAVSRGVADSQENASSFWESHKTKALQSCAVQRAPAALDTPDARPRAAQRSWRASFVMWVPLSIRGLKRALGS